MPKFRLCNRLKVARAEKNLSQEQLGLLAGVTRQTISSIEKGQYNPSALLALLPARMPEKAGARPLLSGEGEAMSTPQSVERDERTVAVENASYRWAYLLLTYALLVDVIYRSLIRHEATWDLLALVVVGGAVCTVYQ